MAEEGVGPKRRKIEDNDHDDIDPVFVNFSRETQQIEKLKFAFESLKHGFSQMNLGFLKVKEVNARASVSFSNATCETTHYMAQGSETKELMVIAGDIFVDGLDILEKYLDDKKPHVPEDELEREALAKLLQFLLEDHEALGEDVYSKAELAILYSQHLLSQLTVANGYTGSIEAHSKGITVCPCKEKDKLVGRKGDTSYGCTKGWHGNCDIMMEDVPVSVMKDESKEVVSEDNEVLSAVVKVSEEESMQLLAQTIVFSFLQRKENGSELDNNLIPGIGVSAQYLAVNFYDCENDVLLTTAPLELFTGKTTLAPHVVVLLWLTLNYKYFCSGITNDMKVYRSGFFEKVGDLLIMYEQDVTRPAHKEYEYKYSWANQPGRHFRTRNPCVEYLKLSEQN